MEQNKESEGGVRSGVATNVMEAVVAAILLGLGGTVAYVSYELGAGWGSDGPGAGYFPFYIGVILIISSLGTLYQALLGKKKNTEVFVDSEQLRRILSVFIPALFFVLAIQLIGIYVASAVYIALFMVKLGKYSPAKGLLLGVAVMTLFFMMFEVWFKVPLYKGMFNPLGFLGY
jgi:hypothetical protein